MGYAPLPVPPAYAGPSGEPGQILLHGITTKVSVFHGRIDDKFSPQTSRCRCG